MPTETPSPSLAELQDWLRWAFTEPRGIERALTRAPAAGELQRRPEPLPRLLGWIEDAPSTAAPRRLSVYSNAYFLRLLDSLASDFKAVRRALGDARFRNLAADFLARTPSTSHNIGDLGEVFPAFIASYPSGRRFRFLADLARLEWTVLRCLTTDRLPPFDASSARDVSPERWEAATLRLDPTVALLDLGWPVDKLWARRDLPETHGIRRLAKPSARALLIHRDDAWVQITALEDRERLAIGMIAEGRPLGAILARLQESRARGGPFDLQAWFSDLVSRGIVKQVLF